MGAPGSTGSLARDPRQLAAVMAERARAQATATLDRSQSEYAAAMTAMTALITAQRQAGMYLPPLPSWIAIRRPSLQWPTP